MRTLEQHFTVNYAFPVYFVKDVFQTDNNLLCSIFLRAGTTNHKVLCVIDSGVVDGHPGLPDMIRRYASAHDGVMSLAAPILTIAGGERCKTDSTWVDMVVDQVRTYGLCRHSFILAVGGGAVLDAVGYAAAVAHRGLRLVRLPTTVLAQNDAGVGVKNGINAFGRKNFVGTFAPPCAVVNDFSLLSSLPPRESRAGIAEALKVALIKDRSFFAYLREHKTELARLGSGPMEEMIHRCAALHMEHIGSGGDPFELGSARPLDFGHWSAHKLEELTGGQINHGEAVAVGMALDSLYSYHLELIEESELRQILSLIAELGLPLYHPALGGLDTGTALAEFREHLGGELAITLLTGIGSKKEVDHIDIPVMQRCIEELMILDSSSSSGIAETDLSLPAPGERQ